MLRKQKFLRFRLLLDDSLRVLLKAEIKTISCLILKANSRTYDFISATNKMPSWLSPGNAAEVNKVAQSMERKNKLLTERRKKEEPTYLINLKLITDLSSFCPGQVSTLPKPQQLTHLLADTDRPKTKRAWKLDKYHSSIGGPSKKIKKKKKKEDYETYTVVLYTSNER